MAPSRSGPRARPHRPIRQNRTRVQTYHESTSEDDANLDADAEYGRSRRPSLTLRPRDIPPSYREESTDADWGDIPDESDAESYDMAPVDPPDQSMIASQAITEPMPRLANAPRRRAVRRTAPSQSSKPKRRRTIKNEPGKPLRKRQKAETNDDIILGSGVIPPWQTLPYQVLFDIFLRASYPLLNEQQSVRTDSVKWLVNVALLCRAFHEPALAALYHTPPLLPTFKSHSLLKLLSMPSSSCTLNYAAKIKELHVDVEQVLLYKSGPTLGYFDLSRLVERTPQVQTLRLYHKDDDTVGIPPWNITPSKWLYSNPLFAAIDQAGLVLRSWDWNARFLPTSELLPFMLEKHLRPAFQGLKKIRLLHLGDGDPEDLTIQEVALATSLQALPEIEHLDLIECTVVKDSFLPRLPMTIRSLTLSNCDRIYSKSFLEFMKSHGQHLRELCLSHNRHLNMAFSTDLALYCPKLRRFKMDISIHDVSTYHDTEPHFTELIKESEIPTWPESLQEIELIQLRRLDHSTAESFFMSLIDSAPKLPDLRKLVISAILRIPWRDRAHFRERWISRLEKTFLRHSQPPNPNLRSLRKRELNNIPPKFDKAEVTSRPGTAGSELSTPSKRHSSRLAEGKASEAHENSEVTSFDLSRFDENDVQGMCDVVSIRIDNQRPSDMQFNENDFLDDEPSDDSDWNGDNYED
ncbi:uncharacterized protein N7443_010905 [Penicillium atrosanguineum]|uniref:F-box domain-containing protein n=1 Tax=Penicillium atrosanguineum TaxID=1132637 RepID=A0A9W9PTA4_9EURO|nr:uncharacterized protein N7443_010905 [Penicillium atrosanguineum]KAJ5290652.1 hypothetical protein N7443_010905 [Penicillium atrosanguineum]KAJ5308476.1 hypothetical protein N7476_009132 [Penicillium atrosanguineum]